MLCYRCPHPKFFHDFHTPPPKKNFMILSQFHALYDAETTCRPCTYVCRFCSFVCRPRELKQGILLLKSCIFPDLGGKKPPPRIIFRNGNIIFF